MMWRKLGTKWESCKQLVDPQKIQEATCEKGVAMPTFELVMVYFPHALGHLKFHYD